MSKQHPNEDAAYYLDRMAIGYRLIAIVASIVVGVLIAWVVIAERTPSARAPATELEPLTCDELRRLRDLSLLQSVDAPTVQGRQVAALRASAAGEALSRDCPVTP